MIPLLIVKLLIIDPLLTHHQIKGERSLFYSWSILLKQACLYCYVSKVGIKDLYLFLPEAEVIIK